MTSLELSRKMAIYPGPQESSSRSLLLYIRQQERNCLLQLHFEIFLGGQSLPPHARTDSTSPSKP